MPLYANIAGAAWIVFMLTWLVLSFFAKRSARGTMLRSFWPRLVMVALLIAIMSSPIRTAANWSYALPAPFEILGDVLVYLGIAYAIWARIYLGTNWGMPQTLKEKPELVTSGPYAYARNPIYGGALMALLGMSLIWPWMAFFFLFSAAYFNWSADVEERLMSQTFPATYPPYRIKTKRFIPFLF